MQSIKKYMPLAFLFLIYMAVFITQPAIIQNIWHYSFDDGTYSHAFLIPIIIIYLYGVLFKEHQLIINEKINYLILLITLILAFFLTLASLIQIPIGFRLALPLFITALIATVFKPTFKVLFPSLFLVFLLPIWGVLTLFLQKLSTVTVSYIMGLSGIPIYVEGNLISIPAGVFEIADGCSGLRYLIVSLAISSLFVFLNIRKKSYALTFIFIAILGALITNWIRITALIVIGHLTNMESELMQDHNSFGWYLYVPFMISLFYFGQKFVDESVGMKAHIPQKDRTSWSSSLSISLVVILLFSQGSRTLLIDQKNEQSKLCEQPPTNVPLPTMYNYTSLCVTEETDYLEINYLYDGASIEGSLHFYMNSFTPENWKIEHSDEVAGWNSLTMSKNSLKYKVEYRFRVGAQNLTRKSELKKVRLSEVLRGNYSSSLIWRINKI